MSAINKVIRIGTNPRGNFFCKIAFGDDTLSITGVEGPKRNGDCIGACGQINMHDWDITDYANGWTADLVTQFRAVWKEWHLNDMRAGSPAQEEFLKANPITDHLNRYSAACKALADAGLNPDNGYKYGSKWLRVEVPQHVIAFLKSLPDTDITPAWV